MIWQTTTVILKSRFSFSWQAYLLSGNIFFVCWSCLSVKSHAACCFLIAFARSDGGMTKLSSWDVDEWKLGRCDLDFTYTALFALSIVEWMDWFENGVSCLQSIYFLNELPLVWQWRIFSGHLLGGWEFGGVLNSETENKQAFFLDFVFAQFQKSEVWILWMQKNSKSIYTICAVCRQERLRGMMDFWKLCKMIDNDHCKISWWPFLMIYLPRSIDTTKKSMNFVDEIYQTSCMCGLLDSIRSKWTFELDDCTTDLIDDVIRRSETVSDSIG